MNMEYRYYMVRCWQPPVGEDKLGHHKTFGVIATDAQFVRDCVKLRHPDLRIDSVDMGGPVHYSPGVA